MPPRCPLQETVVKFLKSGQWPRGLIEHVWNSGPPKITQKKDPIFSVELFEVQKILRPWINIQCFEHILQWVQHGVRQENSRYAITTPIKIIRCFRVHSSYAITYITYHKIIFWCVRKYSDLCLWIPKNNTTGSTTNLDHWITIVTMATAREVVTASHVGVQGVGTGRTPTDLADPKDVVRPGDTGRRGALGNQDEWNGVWNPYTVHLYIIPVWCQGGGTPKK